MKLASVYPESLGYPLDDPPLMMAVAVRDVLSLCRRHGLEPVGAFEMSMVDTFDGLDRALCWRFAASETA